jgi:hypothetical protein
MGASYAGADGAKGKRMTIAPDELWQAEWLADRTEVHPWYGPCDALMDDGSCAECSAVQFEPGYADYKRGLWGARDRG